MATLFVCDEQDPPMQVAGVPDFEPTGPRGAIPTAEQAEAATRIVILGQLANGDRAIELAGVTRLALRKKATVVFGYRVSFNTPDASFLRAVTGMADLRVQRLTNAGLHRVTADASSFDRYLTRFGHADAVVSLGDDLFGSSDSAATTPFDVEILGHVRDDIPAAWSVEVEGGRLYIVPYHTVGRLSEVVSELVEAVIDHTAGTASQVHLTFHDQLELPGEADLRSGLAGHRADVSRIESELSALTRWKQLIGALNDAAFEALARDALALCLAETPAEVVDREERYVEDFWLAQEGADVALCEAKGLSRGIGLGDIDQVNAHRTEHDLSADEMPGLLIVNTFRNDDGLERRGERVHERVCRHARRQNVLVMRSLDLYRATDAHLRGNWNGLEFVQSLKSGGGGWFEVAPDCSTTLHGG